MSQENVELVRGLYDLGRGSLFPTAENIDRAFREYLDEGFEIHLPSEYPEGEQVYRGRDGFAEVLRSFADAWGEFRFEPERFLDAGDRVVVFVRLLARGGGSGAPIELKPAHVLTLRSGRAASIRLYRDRSEALEAAGLSE
jgi:ketosteroid isomerase-like protein